MIDGDMTAAISFTVQGDKARPGNGEPRVNMA
jgi:hypothetical protein